MDDASDLVRRLCVLAGIIMEDVSTVAIVDDGTVSRADAIAQIEEAGRDIAAIAVAASVIARRWGSESVRPS